MRLLDGTRTGRIRLWPFWPLQHLVLGNVVRHLGSVPGSVTRVLVLAIVVSCNERSKDGWREREGERPTHKGSKRCAAEEVVVVGAEEPLFCHRKWCRPAWFQLGMGSLLILLDLSLL